MPPSQIVPALADAGVYIASESSFYRVLRAHSRQHHRGKSSKPIKRPLLTHCATGPNQVWMWDISWLPGPIKGLYFYRPSFPSKGFIDLTEARQWVLKLTHWYNTDHHHSGLNFLTPFQRHNGQSDAIF